MHAFCINLIYICFFSSDVKCIATLCDLHFIRNLNLVSIVFSNNNNARNSYNFNEVPTF